MTPKRIQRKRIKGWKMPPNTVSVTRPGRWGNPFVVGGKLNGWGRAWVAITFGKTPDKIKAFYKSGLFEKPTTLDQSLKWYKAWIKYRIKNGYLKIKDLKGKNLACFCPLGQPCHADILLKLANQ